MNKKIVIITEKDFEAYSLKLHDRRNEKLEHIRKQIRKRKHFNNHEDH